MRASSQKLSLMVNEGSKTRGIQLARIADLYNLIFVERKRVKE
jgi:hypothetical protein